MCQCANSLEPQGQLQPQRSSSWIAKHATSAGHSLETTGIAILHIRPKLVVAVLGATRGEEHGLHGQSSFMRPHTPIQAWQDEILVAVIFSDHDSLDSVHVRVRWLCHYVRKMGIGAT